MTTRLTLSEFEAIVRDIGAGVPDTEQYRRMGGTIVDVPQARHLARLNPFRPEYKQAALDLYLSVRGREGEGYRVARDEGQEGPAPGDLWTGVPPWSFRDATMLAEHLHAWGHVLRHANLPAGGALLEYGPGSGQLLLMAARLGYRACGVDVSPAALDAIERQARHLGLPVHVEAGEFGAGFDGERFDTIVFYEAFHHAFEFEALLVRLHDRLKPGGRVVLCGEPVLQAGNEVVPYPWGPRLDALSLFCVRRFGWMELGFTQDFLLRAARAAGWLPTFHSFPGVPRAECYVLEGPGTGVLGPSDGREALAQNEALRQELAAVYASTSWRLTSPLRRAARALRRR